MLDHGPRRLIGPSGTRPGSPSSRGRPGKHGDPLPLSGPHEPSYLRCTRSTVERRTPHEPPTSEPPRRGRRRRPVRRKQRPPCSWPEQGTTSHSSTAPHCRATRRPPTPSCVAESSSCPAGACSTRCSQRGSRHPLGGVPPVRRRRTAARPAPGQGQGRGGPHARSPPPRPRPGAGRRRRASGGVAARPDDRRRPRARRPRGRPRSHDTGGRRHPRSAHRPSGRRCRRRPVAHRATGRRAARREPRGQWRLSLHLRRGGAVGRVRVPPGRPGRSPASSRPMPARPACG